MPSCIFHIPMEINQKHASASQIRPQKMLQAFRNIGYEVVVVMGRAAERKARAARVIERIDNGEQFDFLYSESSTMPTQLTEPNHFPISESIDFGLFKRCRERKVKIGLFYRDAYWKFPEYKAIGRLKSSIAIRYYKRDLTMYNRLVDVLFFPSNEFQQIIADDITRPQCALLPPGCEEGETVVRIREAKLSSYRDTNQPLRLLYVGGIGAHYGFDSLMDALQVVQNVKATFCVREADFEAYSNADRMRSLANVEIVHASGEELQSLYKDSDVALMFFDSDPYQSIAIPYKTFEYIAYGLPIISNSGIAVASFIRANDVGWVIDGDADSLSTVLRRMASSDDERSRKLNNCAICAETNTWSHRAKQVAELLAD